MDTSQPGGSTGRRMLEPRAAMAPQTTITLADDVFEQIKQRAEAEGKTVEEAANETCVWA